MVGGLKHELSSRVGTRLEHGRSRAWLDNDAAGCARTQKTTTFATKPRQPQCQVVLRNTEFCMHSAK